MREDHEYRFWLMRKMFDDVRKEEDYISLMNALDNYTFTWLPEVPMDENRALDGYHLRMRFLEETGISLPDWYPGTVSMLEMLAALSIRLENQITMSTTGGPNESLWFWIMMGNIGLDEMKGDAFDLDIFIDKINVVVQRMYDSSGNGSLFPLRNPPEDMTKCEIWKQANYYQMENFRINFEIFF